MHYHIFWGLKNAEEPSILNFSNKQEAIDKFISLIKDVEGDSVKDGPPPWEEKKVDEKTLVFRIVSDSYKYMLVYCGYACETEIPAFPMNVN